MEQLLPWLISLVSGGVGGNLGGALVKGIGGGFKTIVGMLGGLLGGQWLGPMLDFLKNLGATGGNVASSAGVGALVTMIIGMFVRKKD
ncbi:MAG: hypothetical protein R3F56_23595 [Planctomycetota bacterium]